MGASPPTEELTAKSGNRFLLRRRLCGKVKRVVFLVNYLVARVYVKAGCGKSACPV